MALCFLAVPMIAQAKDKKDTSADAREKALQLFEKALAISDIRAANSQPFALSGVIEIPTGHGKSAKGSYSLLWAAPERWREEIHFANYSRIRVGGKDEYWQLRSVDYEPLPSFDLDGAFGYLRELRYLAQPNSIAGLQKISFKDEKIAGVKTECALLTQGHDVQIGRSNAKFKTTTTYCFDPSNGGLASMVGWLPLSRPESAFYSDFVAFAGKTVPSTIRVADGNLPSVVLHMSQIVPLGEVDPKMFVPPSGAQEWDSCDIGNLKASELVTQQVPVYPQDAKMSHIAGSVFVYAVVGTDGRLHKMKVLVSPSPLLSMSSLDALQGWRYTPAACNGKPLANETILKIIYNLGD
jgi:hypothetical protein